MGVIEAFDQPQTYMDKPVEMVGVMDEHFVKQLVRIRPDVAEAYVQRWLANRFVGDTKQEVLRDDAGGVVAEIADLAEKDVEDVLLSHMDRVDRSSELYGAMVSVGVCSQGVRDGMESALLANGALFRFGNILVGVEGEDGEEVIANELGRIVAYIQEGKKRAEEVVGEGWRSLIVRVLSKEERYEGFDGSFWWQLENWLEVEERCWLVLDEYVAGSAFGGKNE